MPWAALPEAEASYREACRLRPNFAEAYSNWAGVLRSQGRAAEAVSQCRRALELKPKLVAAHCNLGNALRDLGQTEAAITAYRRALELNPELTEAHNNLGNAQLDLGHVEDALRSYQQAIALQPRDADAHNNAGNALRLPRAFERGHRELPARARYQPKAWRVLIRISATRCGNQVSWHRRSKVIATQLSLRAG